MIAYRITGIVAVGKRLIQKSSRKAVAFLATPSNPLLTLILEITFHAVDSSRACRKL